MARSVGLPKEASVETGFLGMGGVVRYLPKGYNPCATVAVQGLSHATDRYRPAKGTPIWCRSATNPVLLPPQSGVVSVRGNACATSPARPHVGDLRKVIKS